MTGPAHESRDVVLEQARAAYARYAWDQSYQELLRADSSAPLALEDLERLAWAAGHSGRVPEMLATLERLFQAALDAGEPARAARAAFWAGLRLLGAGEPGRASGWLARAQRVVDELGRDCVERGYLMIPLIYRQL